jgi:hypothetical protein
MIEILKTAPKTANSFGKKVKLITQATIRTTEQKKLP